MKELFGQPYDTSDPTWVIKGYFDIIFSDDRFIDAIYHIAHRIGFNTDGAYCNFPDMRSSFEEEHFEGVEFSYGYPPAQEDTICVSEETCFKYVQLACERYLQLHPEDTTKINDVLKSTVLSS